VRLAGSLAGGFKPFRGLLLTSTRGAGAQMAVVCGGGAGIGKRLLCPRIRALNRSQRPCALAGHQATVLPVGSMLPHRTPRTLGFAREHKPVSQYQGVNNN
jgi:hypothetical protein